MPMTKEDVLEALKGVIDPDLKRDVVTLGAVRKCAACDGHVSVTLSLPGALAGASAARAGAMEAATREAVRAAVERAVREKAAKVGDTIKGVSVEFVSGAAPAPQAVRAAVGTESGGAAQGGAAAQGAPGLPGVERVIAVGAGKGGVGKSTIAVNLAVALARGGKAVGLLDGDIYGPSIPTLMGLDGLDAMSQGNMLQPFYVHGVKTMTLGKLVDPEKPLIWRGPMAHGAFKQLTTQTQWGELDYLIIDLPPGTGDVPLTMAQTLSLAGAVVVCTPQKVAQDDAVRAAAMFQQLNIPLLGVVENMSYFIGDDGKEYDLFGKGGAEAMARSLAVPFLGAVPISMALRLSSDAGTPLKNFEDGRENAALKAALEGVARNVESQVALSTMTSEWGRPRLTVT